MFSTLADELKIFNNVISITYESKAQKRGSDCREAAILLCQQFQLHPPIKSVQQLFDSLAELCKLFYEKAYNRSPKKILRVHNYTFLHAMAVPFLIGTPVKMTMRRMYGRHYHALCTHAPIINRLRCLRSINTEEEERFFQHPKEYH